MSTITSLRIDEETNNMLSNLSKISKLSKSDIIRMALGEFIERAYINEEYPPIKRWLAYYRAKQLEKEIKQIRYMGHLLNTSRKWITYIEKVKRGEIKENPNMNKTYSVIINQSEEVMNKLLELEKKLVDVIMEYQKTLEVREVEA